MSEQRKAKPARKPRRYPERVTPEEAARLAAERAARIVADKGERALIRLLAEADQAADGDSRANAIVRLLAALYEGFVYPADLSYLRWLDASQLDDMLAVLRMEGSEGYLTIERVPGAAALLRSLIERKRLPFEQRSRAETMAAFWDDDESSRNDDGKTQQSNG